MAYLDVVKSTKESSDVQLTTAQTRNVIETFFTVLSAAVAEGSVRVPYFGTFKTKTKAARSARMGRNPSTGEPMEIAAQPAKEVISFKQSKA
jgi:nucleoid DNA-binding protein